VLVKAGDRIVAGIENSAEPQRVVALLEHIGTLPVILKTLEESAEREQRRGEELSASFSTATDQLSARFQGFETLPSVLTGLQESAKRAEAVQQELVKTMGSLARSADHLAKAAAGLGRTEGGRKPWSSPATDGLRGPSVTSVVVPPQVERRSSKTIPTVVAVSVLALSSGSMGYGLMQLPSTHLGAGLAFGGALLTYEAMYVLYKEVWKQ
jgi:hypothetical protein